MRPCEKLKLRRAVAEDCKQLWVWRNEPYVRAASFDGRAIEWDEHVRWFEERMADPDSLLYIVVDENGEPIGQVRLDRYPDGSAEINISIDAEVRNRGCGSAALREFLDTAREHQIQKLLAHIKPENRASVCAFGKAGFTDHGTLDFKGQRAIEMLWEPHEPV